jgi:hypothetical protein
VFRICHPRLCVWDVDPLYDLAFLRYPFDGTMECLQFQRHESVQGPLSLFVSFTAPFQRLASSQGNPIFKSTRAIETALESRQAHETAVCFTAM